MEFKEPRPDTQYRAVSFTFIPRHYHPFCSGLIAPMIQCYVGDSRLFCMSHPEVCVIPSTRCMGSGVTHRAKKPDPLDKSGIKNPRRNRSQEILLLPHIHAWKKSVAVLR